MRLTLFILILLTQIISFSYAEIKEMVEVPFKMKFVVSSDNGAYLLSENGRFVVKGSMVDLWTGKYVKTVDDFKDLQVYDLKQMRVPYKDWGVIYYQKTGNTDDLVVFIDVLDPKNTKETLKKLDKMLSDLNYNIYILPIESSDSKSVNVSQIYCANKIKRKNDLLTLINGGALDETPDCSVSTYLSIKTISKLFGISQYPAFLANGKLLYDLNEIGGNL